MRGRALDAVIMALAWGAAPRNAWWNILAGINHDGVIGITDGMRIGLR